MKKLIKITSSILLITITLLGGFYFMNKQAQRAREDELYRHAFSLLEEQIATYIVEHYAGVSKVEFSPIYVVETDMYNMGSINVVPVIYDEYGNRSALGGNIPNQNISFARLGLNRGLSSVDFTIEGHHFIYLSNSKNGEEIDVSNAETLPEEAKLTKSWIIDDNIMILIEDKQLKGVSKDDNGSSKAEVIYNLEVIRGEVEDKWR